MSNVFVTVFGKSSSHSGGIDYVVEVAQKCLTKSNKCGGS